MSEHVVRVGEVIEGRYKILGPIAEGGMGTVFLAEHWLIKRRVAIKILHKDLADDAVMLRRFMNEALAAGTLGHPNIVESTDMGFVRRDIPYIVFEYLEGTVLADEVLLGPLGVPRVVYIAHQVASALEAAHGAGIVHRDLKSDNIFLTTKGDRHDHVKVLDFGISRFQTSDRTAQGANLLGTPEFMAPEQIMTPEAIDHRADIYALGVMMYEMLTGSVPFKLAKQHDVDAAHELLTRVVHDPPPPFRCADAPPGLVDLVTTRLLAKDPADRPQTMADVQRALERLGALLPTGPILMRRPPTGPVDPAIAELWDQTLSRSRLSEADLAREVKTLGKRWSLQGTALVLDYYSRDPRRMGSIVEHAMSVAGELDHQDAHITLEGPHLRLALGDGAGVVALVFAARIEQWLRDHDA